MRSYNWLRVKAAALLGSLAGEDIDGVPVTSLGDQLVELRETIDRLEHEFTRRLHSFGSQRGYAVARGDDGALTLAPEWTRLHSRHGQALAPPIAS